jgi:hypothetical protein
MCSARISAGTPSPLTELSVVFLSHSRQILGQYFERSRSLPSKYFLIYHLSFHPTLYRVSQVERTIFCEFTVSVILSKKKCNVHMSYSERFPRYIDEIIGDHQYLPANWKSVFQWSPDQWVSQSYAIECYRSFYCALFCVFMTRVSQRLISLRSEHHKEKHTNFNWR